MADTVRAALLGLAAFLVAAGLGPGGARAAGEISRLVVFGDSNVAVSRAAVGAPVAPARVFPAFVAARLGVAQVNFAANGATAAVDLATQIAAYAASSALSNDGALHLVMAGSNDLSFVDKNDAAAVDGAVARAEASLRAAVVRLDALGARLIVLATRTPRPVLSLSDRVSDEPDPAARNDAAGRQLNGAIRRLAAELDARLAARVAVFDVDAEVRALIAGSGANGFAPYASGPSQFCVNSSDCGALINHDPAHKTPATHAALAERFIAQFAPETAALAPRAAAD